MALVLMLTAMFLLAPRSADACTCLAPRLPCQAAFEAQAVFTGTVTAVRDTSGGRLVDIRVARALRADPGHTLSDTVTIETGFGDGDCGYPFEVGQRYLVYANRPRWQGSLHTSICSRTRRLSEADDDLLYFAALDVGASPTRVFGQLRAWGEGQPPPVAGITIELRGPSSLRTAVTDRDGRFEFLHVPVGGYDVFARVPASLVPAHTRELVFLAAGACAEIDLIARWDGRLAGTLVRADRTPVSGFNLEARREGERFSVYATTDETGAFTFAGLAPGRYTLGTNLASPPRPDRPYATAAIRTGVAVAPGEHVTLGTLQTPDRLGEVPVSGTVRFVAGPLPPDARLILQPIWEGRPYVGTSISVANDGAYRLVALEGVEYEIVVAWSRGRHRAGRFVAGRSTPPDPLIVPER